MNFPSNLKYSEDHEWIMVDNDIAYIGITDFAQNELGDIVYFDVNTIGETLAAGKIFGTVEAVKAVSDLFMPASGEIIEKNPLLDSNPETVNKDPYVNGWIIKIKLTQKDDLNKLLSSEDYVKLVQV